jgi:hypothetical protein
MEVGENVVKCFGSSPICDLVRFMMATSIYSYDLHDLTL